MIDKFSFGFELFETFHDMCFILSHEGEILELNNSASETLELEKNVAIGMNFFDFIDKSDREKFRLVFTDSIINSSKGSIFAKWNINQRETDLSISISPITNKEEGNQNLFFILAKDFTEQRKKKLIFSVSIMWLKTLLTHYK